MPQVPTHTLESSMVDQLGYIPRFNMLVVKFETNQTWYHYYDVEPWVYWAVMMASSHGKAMHRFVIDQYDFKKIGGSS